MTKTSLLLFGAVLATTSHVAHADQCARTTKSVADKAAELVKKGATVLEFVHRPGQPAPGR